MATRPLLQYAQLIAPGALTDEHVQVTTEAGYPVGCLQGKSKSGLGHVRLCTTRDGLLTEVDYKGVADPGHLGQDRGHVERSRAAGLTSAAVSQAALASLFTTSDPTFT